MLEKLFKLKERNTTIRTEVVAGITTFMTMSYILVVNPAILSTTGMDSSSVFTATALSAAIGTLIMAFTANRPIALASGMDLNSLFAFVIVQQMGYSWQFALTACLISGILYFALSFTSFHRAIFNAFPEQLKYAISVGVGLFITFVGLQSSGLIVDSSTTLTKLGTVFSTQSFITLAGVLSIGVMLIYKVRGALLVGIIVGTIIGIPLGVSSYDNLAITPDLFTMPSLAPTFMQFEWEHIFTFDMFTIVTIILFADVFDTTGTIIALGIKGNWFNKDGTITGIKNAYRTDAFSTIISSILGTSPTTSYIESASGMAEGGKTGLTSVVVACLFIISLFFAPIFLLVPVQASSAALIMVGVFMMVPVTKIDFTDYVSAIPAFAAIMLMPLTSQIAHAIFFSLIAYIVLALFSGRIKEVSPLAIAIALLAIGREFLIEMQHIL